MAAAIAANVLLMPVVAEEDTLRAIADSESSVRIHGLLMLINCLAVVGIGVLCLPLFRERYPFVAFSYLTLRLVESIVLIIGILAVLTLPGIAKQAASASVELQPAMAALLRLALDTNWHAYHAAMVALGVGSLGFVYLLLKEQLVPKILAILGLIGYVVLAATSILALLGVKLSLIVTLPVFVFEVWFGVYLILYGFRSNAPTATG